MRALASGKANGIGRRPILIGGVAGVTTAQMGNLGNQQARAVEATPVPDTAAMAPAVAAIAPLKPGAKLADGAFEVLCSTADTAGGVTMAQLGYVVHCTLRSGSRGVLAALLRALLGRTFCADLRLIELLLEGNGKAGPSASDSLRNGATLKMAHSAVGIDSTHATTKR